MSEPRSPLHPHFRHEVLIHDDDASLVSATRRFVSCALDAGGDVLVHSNRRQIAVLEDQLVPDPRLTYGYDEEMYVEPTRTLFEYQRQLAAREPGARELWVTGTVPLGSTKAEQAAWARYESAVNEALGTFPFHALCTYDARTLPAGVISAARATHPVLNIGLEHGPCPDYRTPADFLADPQAEVPQAPGTEPTVVTCVDGPDDMAALRSLIRVAGLDASAVSRDAIEDLILALHEVTANGVIHGTPPVVVKLWASLAEIIVQVVDAGPGDVDPLVGYRYPEPLGAVGLWAARQAVDDLFIDSPSSGGCRVLLVKT